MPRHADQTNDDILPQGERLQALSPEEYELLWGHPVFSDSGVVPWRKQGWGSRADFGW